MNFFKAAFILPAFRLTTGKAMSEGLHESTKITPKSHNFPPNLHRRTLSLVYASFVTESHGPCPRCAAVLKLDWEGNDFKTVRRWQRPQIHLVNKTELALAAGVVNREELIFPTCPQCLHHRSNRTIQRFTVTTNHPDSLIQEPEKSIQF